LSTAGHPNSCIVDPGAAPDRGVIVLDQFRVQLLTAQARAAIAPLHRLDEARRKVAGIVARRALRDHHVAGRQKVLHRLDRARRRRDRHARVYAEPQRHQDHVERALRVVPFGKFVGPDGVKLMAAYAVRLIGRKHVGDRAIAP
jgi:hypothetical protein